MRQFILITLVITLFSACKAPEARRPVSASSSTFIKESIKRNKKLIAAEEDAIKSLIAKDTTHKYLASSNGFWYYYSKRDTAVTKTPGFGDLVTYDYSIYALNGATIYSHAATETKTYAMDQEELISGIREGLKLLHEGETATFLLPSHKAYGYYGDKKKIGRNLPINVTITVNSITTQNKDNQ